MLLILLCSVGYAQSNISSAVIGNDTVFIMNRSYAELVALRFDSLKTYKDAYKQCNEVLDYSLVIINSQDTLLTFKDKKIVSLESEILTTSQLIESYKRTEIISADIKKQLKKETRKRKLWQVVGIGAGAGLLTTILILAI